MGFWDDFGTGFVMPFDWAYDKAKKVDHVGDAVLNSAGTAIGGTADIIGGIGNVLSGNSNILVYCGIALVAVIIVPKLLDKVL